MNFETAYQDPHATTFDRPYSSMRYGYAGASSLFRLESRNSRLDERHRR